MILAQVFQEATERHKHRARPCEDQTRDDRRLQTARCRFESCPLSAGDLRRRADSHNSQLSGSNAPVTRHSHRVIERSPSRLNSFQ